MCLDPAATRMYFAPIAFWEEAIKENDETAQNNALTPGRLSLRRANPIANRRDWDAMRAACEADIGAFHAGIAKSEIHWFADGVAELLVFNGDPVARRNAEIVGEGVDMRIEMVHLRAHAAGEAELAMRCRRDQDLAVEYGRQRPVAAACAMSKISADE